MAEKVSGSEGPPGIDQSWVTLDALQEAYIRLDSQLRFAFVNAAAERLLGESKAGVTGKTPWQVRPETTGTPLERNLRRAQAEAAVVSFENYYEPWKSWYAITAMPDGSGGLIVHFSDITERKAAGKAVAEAEKKYREIFEGAVVGILRTSFEGKLLVANPAMAELLGYDSAEEILSAIGEASHQIWLNPGERSRFWETVVKNGGRHSIECQFQRKDGTPIWVCLNGRSVFDVNGQTLYFEASVRDITAQKSAEDALRESEARLREAEHVAQIGSWSWDVVRDITAYSDELCRINGWDANPPSLKYADLEKSFAPESWRRLDRAVKHALATGQPYDLELATARREGGERRVQARGAAARDGQGRVIRLFGTVQDITARKLADEALRAAHAELAAIHAHAPMLFVVVNEDLRVEKMNEATAKLTGRPERELLGLRPGAAIGCPHALEDPRGCGYSASCGECAIRLAVLDSVRHRNRHDNVEAWVSHAVGGKVEERCLLVFTAPLDVPGPAKALVCALDITDRKKSERELRDREHWLRESQRVSQVGSYVLDLKTGFWKGSETLDEIFGIGPDYRRDVASWVALVHPAQRQEMAAYFQNEVLGQRKLFDREYRIVRPGDGRLRWVHGRGRVLDSPDGALLNMAGTIQDITERKSIEEQFLQAQKLESVGRLAGGVAHDFNNLLTIINGYGDLMLESLQPGDPLRASLVEIRKAGDRAAELTRRLLAFSRKQVIEPRPVNLNEAITEARGMLRRIVGEDIEMAIDLDPESGRVMADMGQLHQVLMNLVVNARDAMPSGGRLTLRSSRTRLDADAAAQFPGMAPGDYVVLEVTDSGVGMSEEIRQKLFEPFFTTKPEGTGTGLGLSTVYGIVRQAGGWIQVESQPGMGATFRIGLPWLAQSGPPSEAAELPALRLEGWETILVVEDEDEVRRFALAVLKSFHYRTLEARSGGEALLIVENHSGPIHLMLTDVVMPQMTGKQLVDRLRTVRPEMKVLYMSGYAADMISRQGLDSETGYIEKPFRPEALARKVRTVLGVVPSAPKVLVVDDELSIRGLFARVLQGGGYEVAVACDGLEARKALESGSFDLMITDLVMPESEGIETIQAIRKSHADVKIIAVSGAFGGGYLAVAAMLGADATLTKPVSPEQLLEAVRQALA